MHPVATLFLFVLVLSWSPLAHCQGLSWCGGHHGCRSCSDASHACLWCSNPDPEVTGPASGRCQSEDGGGGCPEGWGRVSDGAKCPVSGGCGVAERDEPGLKEL